MNSLVHGIRVHSLFGFEAPVRPKVPWKAHSPCDCELKNMHDQLSREITPAAFLFEIMQLDIHFAFAFYLIALGMLSFIRLNSSKLSLSSIIFKQDRIIDFERFLILFKWPFSPIIENLLVIALHDENCENSFTNV